MAFDGIMMSALKAELSNLLIGAKTEKITQPEKDEAVFYLHAFDKEMKRNASYRLLLCVNPSYPRIHLTSQNRENPVVAPNFCMLLRKHLLGARITDIRQNGTERVLELVFEGRSDMYETTERHLFVEIMGHASNMILTSGDKRILDALHQSDITSASKRALLPGIVYEMPPAQEKMSFSDSALSLPDGFFDSDERTDKQICNSILGFSPTLAREIAYRALKRYDIPVSSLSLTERESLKNEITALSKRLSTSDFEPCVVFAEKPTEFCFITLTQYENTLRTERYASCSEAVEAFYSERSRSENMKRYSSDITKILQTHISRLSRKAEAQRGELKDCDKAETYRLYGDLITANMNKISRGDKSARLTNYYSETLEPVTVELDVRLSPAKNAQKYYKLYKKAQTARSILSSQIPEALNEIVYLESVLGNVKRCETYTDLAQIREEMSEQGYIRKTRVTQKTPPRTSPLEFISDDGYRICVGKNNIQNDILTLKTAQKHDYWLHIKKYTGSHVIVFCEGTVPPDRTLEQAAILAATYSSAADGDKTEVDYTEVRNVKKPSGAKPGMVIYDIFKTAVVSPDRELAKRLSAKNSPTGKQVNI